MESGFFTILNTPSQVIQAVSRICHYMGDIRLYCDRAHHPMVLCKMVFCTIMSKIGLTNIQKYMKMVLFESIPNPIKLHVYCSGAFFMPLPSRFWSQQIYQPQLVSLYGYGIVISVLFVLTHNYNSWRRFHKSMSSLWRWECFARNLIWCGQGHLGLVLYLFQWRVGKEKGKNTHQPDCATPFWLSYIQHIWVCMNDHVTTLLLNGIFRIHWTVVEEVCELF